VQVDEGFEIERPEQKKSAPALSLVVQDTREAGHRKPEANAKLWSISGSVTISVIGSIGDPSNPSLR
jgi:hypothetical protein